MLDVSLTISTYFTEHSEGLKYLMSVFCHRTSSQQRSPWKSLQKGCKSSTRPCGTAGWEWLGRAGKVSGR